MADILFSEKYPVVAKDFVSAGEKSAFIKKNLKKLGIDSSIIRKISIAAYESEINMVIHSYGGEMSLEVTPDDVTVICKDTGPGIADVNLAMKEGYSTASEEARNMGFGAGMGLPNIMKNSSDLSVDTSPAGTTITMKFKL